MPIAAQTPAPTPTTAFVHVAVIPMDREQVLPDQTVLVQGDRITALGPASQVAVPAGAARVDGTGQFLIPGLADMHVHLGSQEKWRPSPEIDLADALFVLLAKGVTTVRDMHSGSPWTGDSADMWMITLRRRIAKGELLGPRIYAAGDPDVTSPEAAAKSIATLKAAGYDFVKLYSWSGPLYDSTVVPARRVGLPVVGHVPLDVGLSGVLKDRWASMEHLLGYYENARGVQSLPLPGDGAETGAPQSLVDDTMLRRLALETKQAGAWNCPTLDILRTFYSAPADAAQIDFYSRLVKALQEAGAELLLGSDVVYRSSVFWDSNQNPLPSVHTELPTLVKAGLTPYQALATGTRNAARFLGTEDSTGTVAVGKCTDLVLLRGNPLTDIHNTGAVAGVMVGGRWLSRTELNERIQKMR